MGTINKKPLVGFGVVGKKTLINSSLVLFEIMPSFFLVANPTAQTPFLGYSIKTTLFFFEFDCGAKVSVNWPMAE